MALAPRASVIPAPYVVPATDTFDGDDGSWSTFSIHVGTPGQDFRVLPSTSGSETWVPVPEGCTSDDPSNCANLRGAQPFHGSPSSGFLTNASSTWNLIGLYSLDLESDLGYTGNGEYGYDTVGLGTSQDTSSLSLPKQTVTGIADKSYYMGILGLGIRPSSFSNTAGAISTLFSHLKANGTIPSLSYGYTAGAPYRLKKVPGQLILGGYDSTRYDPLNPAFSFSFSSDATQPLTVGVQSIIASNTLLGVASFTTAGYLAVIDSTVPHLWLPTAVCDQMANAFGLTYDNVTDLYFINDTMHAQMQSLNPTVTLKLGNTAYSSSNSTNIQLPYAAFDLTCSPPLCTNSTNYFPIRRAANETQYVLGRTLLQESYLIVDYERSNFTIAPAVWPDPLPSAHIVTIQSVNSTSDPDTNNSTPSSSLPLGAIIGIAVGGAVLLIACAVLFFLWYRHHRRVANEKNILPPQPPALDDKKDDSLFKPNPDMHKDPTELELTSPLPIELAVDSETEVKHGYRPIPVQEMHTPEARHEMPEGSYWGSDGGGRGSQGWRA